MRTQYHMRWEQSRASHFPDLLRIPAACSRDPDERTARCRITLAAKFARLSLEKKFARCAIFSAGSPSNGEREKDTRGALERISSCVDASVRMRSCGAGLVCGTSSRSGDAVLASSLLAPRRCSAEGGVRTPAFPGHPSAAMTQESRCFWLRNRGAWDDQRWRLDARSIFEGSLCGPFHVSARHTSLHRVHLIQGTPTRLERATRARPGGHNGHVANRRPGDLARLDHLRRSRLGQRCEESPRAVEGEGFMDCSRTLDWRSRRDDCVAWSNCAAFGPAGQAMKNERRGGLALLERPRLRHPRLRVRGISA